MYHKREKVLQNISPPTRRPLSAHLIPEEYEQFRELADRLHTNSSALLRVMIQERLKEEDNESK